MSRARVVHKSNRSDLMDAGILRTLIDVSKNNHMQPSTLMMIHQLKHA